MGFIIKKMATNSDACPYKVCGPTLTHSRNNAIAKVVRNMKASDKSELYRIIATMGSACNEDTFIPRHGITLGQFAFYQTLIDYPLSF